MSGQENAASPVTVRDALRSALGWQRSHGVPTGTDWHVRNIVEALGIDPDMPVETLKRRLLWGERVEQAVDALAGPGMNNVYRDAQRDLVFWITTSEILPSQEVRR